MFATDEHSIQRLQERLSDPQERAAMRAEHRTSIEAGHPDLAEVLGIDAATEQKFFDLLADQQVQRLIEFHERRAPAPGQQMLQDVADAQTKMIEAQREVLGEEAMERYRDYMDTLGARLQVARLDAWLASRDKLGTERKTRLISLMHEHDPLRQMARVQTAPRRLRALEVADGNITAPGFRALRVDHLGRMEEMLNRTLDSDRQLLAAASQFLAAPQLTALGGMRAENVSRLRRQVEQTRAYVGADSAMSAVREAQPAEADDVRKAVVGDIKVEVSV
ncbi:MAG: hypothetical protein ACREUC_19580, partial [Steroidobacteraceae bacterium]